MRTIYYWDKEKKELTTERPHEEVENCYHVIDDEMPATWHPITGEMMTSKRAFRAVTKAHGCIETDGEYLSKLPPRKHKQTIPREEMREAILRSLDHHGHRRD